MQVSHAPPDSPASTVGTLARLGATDRRSGMPAGKVLLAGALALALAIVLNSQQLLREAQQKPFGAERDVSVAVWEPVEGASSAVGLHLPRLWVDEAFGRSVTDPGATADSFSADAGGGTVEETRGDAAAADPDSAGVVVASAAVSSQGADQAVSADGPATIAPVTTVAWFPTPAEPLRLHIMGDSMVQFFGHVMVGLANDTGVIEASTEHQLSSGLSRPDFYDWPTRIVEVMAAEDPDAVVLMFGGNDAQAIVVDGQIARRFSDAWVAEYSARVGHVMDLVTTDPDRVLIWVGQPIMEDPTYDSRMQQVNEIFRAEAAKRDRVHYVDTRNLFRGPNGGFSRYVADADGQLADVRLTDGVHLSTLGGRWLSQVLLDELGLFVDLSSGAPS
ncbi:DUF459 domain-containing protein [Candidatus Poriferisodalis sp.]|uniref:SGNH/GDSL hydrolase family protein n=1 Tax=Candidatus Poriferisodalis sp. TaxID=3101277 RepID=UPI003B01C014